MEEIHRYAGFSSSSIHKLVKEGSRKMTPDELRLFKEANPKSTKKNCDEGFQKAGLTYIKQVRHEKRLGKRLKKETSAKQTSWGKFMEKRAFDLMPDLSFRLVSKTRYKHQTIDNWTGMPDLIKELHVGDIKCPYDLETFCDKIDALKDIQTYKKEFEEDYWQNISNACILESNGIKVNKMVPVIYVPYVSELEQIRDDVYNFDGDQNSIAWINWAEDDQLPCILEGRQDVNMNIFLFDIPREDMEYLESRVIEANKLL